VQTTAASSAEAQSDADADADTHTDTIDPNPDPNPDDTHTHPDDTHTDRDVRRPDSRGEWHDSHDVRPGDVRRQAVLRNHVPRNQHAESGQFQETEPGHGSVARDVGKV
jgi:hypothetical protein